MMDSRFRTSVLVLTILSVFGLSDASSRFGYEGEHGPEHWPAEYPTCGGKHQSPINIASHLVLQVDLPFLEFSGYDVDTVSSTLTNNGHTVMLQLNSSTEVTVHGGPLKSKYVFAQLHFHWGANDSLGSEDTINDHSFPMELHIVSYKKEYGSVGNAGDYEDGLAVLAFFFEVNDTDNDAYSEIVDALPRVDDPETYVPLSKPLSLFSLMAANRLKYYTYHGSLTTPPCSEVVTWIDFEEPILLSHNQIDEFRKIHSNEGLMTHNYRPVQPVGERTLWYNRGSWNDHTSSANAATGSVVASLILATLVGQYV